MPHQLFLDSDNVFFEIHTLLQQVRYEVISGVSSLYLKKSIIAAHINYIYQINKHISS